MTSKTLNHTETIKNLNDAFRRHPHLHGHLMITHGVQALGNESVQKICRLVSEFGEFTKDNDPYQEHDFGSLDFEKAKIFWKIDYYANDLMHGSENPADPSITTRVMTIMLAEEY